MVFFTLTANILDTLLIKTTMFTGELILRLIKNGSYSIINYYYPNSLTISDNEKLKIELQELRNKIDLLENNIIVLD